jgi:hypothetical protein
VQSGCGSFPIDPAAKGVPQRCVVLALSARSWSGCLAEVLLPCPCDAFVPAHPLCDHTTREGIERGGEILSSRPPDGAESSAVRLRILSD